jgi:hypothetical protein
MAVTASMCAKASEVALLVASFMPFSPYTWARLIVARNARKTVRIYSEHPTRRVFAYSKPLVANIDGVKIE